MDIQNKHSGSASPDPVKRTPDGENMFRICEAINWQIPTWIEDELYKAEFTNPQHVVSMFNALGSKIESLSATEEPKDVAIAFDYWRRPNSGATKRKPLPLVATLYQHPDYDTFWMQVLYA